MFAPMPKLRLIAKLLVNSALKELVITDSILPTEATRESDRIRILTIAPLIGEAIRRIADESSVSSLFD